MIKKNIQQRVEVPEGKKEITEFNYNGKNYQIIMKSIRNDLIPKALPAGVIFTGFTRQYICKRLEDGKLIEAYVYYYTKMEGKNIAVLDAIEEN